MVIPLHLDQPLAEAPRDGQGHLSRGLMNWLDEHTDITIAVITVAGGVAVCILQNFFQFRRLRTVHMLANGHAYRIKKLEQELKKEIALQARHRHADEIAKEIDE